MKMKLIKVKNVFTRVGRNLLTDGKNYYDASEFYADLGYENLEYLI